MGWQFSTPAALQKGIYVSDEKFVAIQIVILICYKSLLFGCFQDFFPLGFGFSSLIMMCLAMDFLSCLGFVALLKSVSLSFTKFWTFPAILFLLLWDFSDMNVRTFYIVLQILKALLIFFPILF